MEKKNLIIITDYQSPCGTLVLGSFQDKLCLCDWLVESHHKRVKRHIERILHAEFEIGISEIIRLATTQLNEYFQKKRRQFSIPLLFTGTDFQNNVWNELVKIPFGTTASYSEIASRIGQPAAVRATANANGANPLSIFVPCHRVIGRNGTLTGYGGGLDTKLFLLQLEGLYFQL